jgi:predicted RNA-binding protein with PUA-like domain
MPARPRRFWLMKSEPDVFGFDDLLAAPGRTTSWEGVRNYQARNFMRDEMAVGDRVLYYHSNAEPAGVAGIAEVARAAYPDPTAFDPASAYHDPKSDPADPVWLMVDVRAVEGFPRVVTLAELRAEPALAEMVALRRGNRLSVTPVTAAEWKAVCRLGRAGRAAGARGG